ncbi:hypothetical protein SmJEL517_g03237 [Synchytrium microbalum]|uniref:Uncharacterized protein n=1 Tax=Synchytrium microbalum TaxID=1806994 RepID=A0A507C7M3_9FUNG|nr:uncharacterized protein SmJEL517_g03237 [Synchytrium microbalum]TPX34064.1 hypothetical protein SmJEL517_g03237 [Synchytrium microbalum]
MSRKSSSSGASSRASTSTLKQENTKRHIKSPTSSVPIQFKIKTFSSEAFRPFTISSQPPPLTPLPPSNRPSTPPSRGLIASQQRHRQQQQQTHQKQVSGKQKNGELTSTDEASEKNGIIIIPHTHHHGKYHHEERCAHELPNKRDEFKIISEGPSAPRPHEEARKLSPPVNIDTQPIVSTRSTPKQRRMDTTGSKSFNDVLRYGNRGDGRDWQRPVSLVVRQSVVSGNAKELANRDTSAVIQAPNDSHFYLSEQDRFSSTGFVDRDSIRAKQTQANKLKYHIKDKNLGNLAQLA